VRADDSRKTIDTIVRRQKNWVMHVIRGNGVMQEAMEGRMLGKRCPVRAMHIDVGRRPTI